MRLGKLSPGEWLFVSICGLAGAVIVYSATSGFGMGVSSDSMHYISSADSFLAGNGFRDFKGDPLVDFPPLYSLILAIARGLSGVRPFVWARYINIMIMIPLIAGSGILIRQVFPAQRLWFVLGTIATLVFFPLYTLATTVSTEPLFMLMMLWFSLLASSFLEKPDPITLIMLVLLAASATLLRWIGLSFVVALFLLTVYAYRRQLKHKWWVPVISSGASLIPIMLWVGLRNIYLLGTSGRVGYVPDMVDELKNIELTLARIVGWTTPLPAIFCLGPLFIFLILVLFLNRKEHWRQWLQRLAGHTTLPIILLSTIYIVATIFTSWTGDHLDVRDDRYQVPLFFSLLLVFFVSVEVLIMSHLTVEKQNQVLFIVVALMFFWGGVHTGRIFEYIKISKEQGVIVYNEYNTRQLVTSGLVEYLKKNPIDQRGTLYSNVPEAVYFFFERHVEMAPWDPENYYADPVNLQKYYIDWPPQEDAYLIFFKPNYKHHHYEPAEIARIADLTELYIGEDGEVYIVQPKRK
jgi:hypothetical protein